MKKLKSAQDRVAPKTFNLITADGMTQHLVHHEDVITIVENTEEDIFKAILDLCDAALKSNQDLQQCVDSIRAFRDEQTASATKKKSDAIKVIDDLPFGPLKDLIKKGDITIEDAVSRVRETFIKGNKS